MKSLIRINSDRPPYAPLFRVGPHETPLFTREYVVQQLQELAIRAGLADGA